NWSPGRPSNASAAAPYAAATDRRSFPDIFHHPLRADFGAVDVARRIRGDAFRRARARGLFDGVGNERRHRAVLGAADPDASLPAVMVLGHGFRLGICDIDVVVPVDENSARPAELRPLIEEFPVLVEDLDAI